MSAETVAIAIANLAPSLITAGFVVADTIKDINKFEHDAALLELRFGQCSRKLEATQRLVLDSDKIVKGKLLDQLSPESQNCIYRIFVELYLLFISYTQSEAKYRLERANLAPLPDIGPVEGESLATSILGIDQPLYTYARKAPWHRRLGWGISGKKKAFLIVAEYEEWLNRLRDEILQFWWPLPPFNNIESMVALSKDADAQVAGIADHASTSMLLVKDELPQDAKEIWLPRSAVRLFKAFETVEGSLAWGKWEDGSNVCVEYKADGQDNSGNIEQTTLDRLAKIGLLLRKQNDERFRVLKLFKLGHQFLDQRVGFVYHFPDGAVGAPRSLLSLIPEEPSTNRPPLGVRMELAYRLCQSMYLLHSVDWLHKSFRSENIIFFPTAATEALEAEPEPPSSVAKLVAPGMRIFEAPWIIGFEFSRTDNDFSSRRREDLLTRNIYRHPRRWGLPSERHTKVHDIYALGVVLLEIGLWQRCSQLDESGSGFQNTAEPSQVQKLLLEHTKRRLGYTAGERFQKLAWQCLQGDAQGGFGIENDDKADSKLKQAFRENVVFVLDEIHQCL